MLVKCPGFARGILKFRTDRCLSLAQNGCFPACVSSYCPLTIFSLSYAWNRPNHHIPDIQIHIHVPDIHSLKLVVRLVHLLLFLKKKKNILLFSWGNSYSYKN